ncbi:MAG: VWA domain-containing protein [Candidatus Lokiarchaeota archaeon]
MNKKQLIMVIAIIGLLSFSFTFFVKANGVEVQQPTVTKNVTPEDIYFGEGIKQTTVNIEVTGAGGTSTTITPMDVVFAIDSSGSMISSDPSGLRRTAAKFFVDQMDNSRDQGGVVSWDDGIDFTYGLTTDFALLKNKIDNVDSSGGTNLNVGLSYSIAMLNANTRVSTSSEIIIFLTDGVGSYTYSGNAGSQADIAASKGYVIYSIGLGPYVSMGPLIDMAAATGGQHYSSPSNENLLAIYAAIYEEIVTSTIPHYVDVIEVTQDYIVGHSNFNILPDSISTNLDGTTTLIWNNIGLYSGDSDPDLSADEIVTLNFSVWSTVYGMNLPVEVEGEAIVKYYDVDYNYIGYVDIPQATINVHPYVTDLIAGGGNEKSAIDVGDLIVWNDMDYLYINYVTNDGWFMTETHLHVATTLDGIPQTKKYNPIPGHFDYIDYHDPSIQNFIYTIPLPDDWTTLYVAAHAVVQKIIGYSPPSMEEFSNALPDHVIMSVMYPYAGGPAYFPVTTITGDPFTGTYEGWCIDTDHVIYQNTPYNSSVYSSYELLPVGLIEYPENLDLVNWIINQELVGQPSGCDGIYTYGDIQRAIWELVEDNPSASGLGVWSQCRVDEILTNAFANGEGFVPGCGDSIAVILAPITGEQVIITQVTFIDVGLECTPIFQTETAWADGLDFEGKNWATYFTYLDP